MHTISYLSFAIQSISKSKIGGIVGNWNECWCVYSHSGKFDKCFIEQLSTLRKSEDANESEWFN